MRHLASQGESAIIETIVCQRNADQYVRCTESIKTTVISSIFFDHSVVDVSNTP